MSSAHVSENAVTCGLLFARLDESRTVLPAKVNAVKREILLLHRADSTICEVLILDELAIPSPYFGSLHKKAIFNRRGWEQAKNGLLYSSKDG